MKNNLITYVTVATLAAASTMPAVAAEKLNVIFVIDVSRSVAAETALMKEEQTDAVNAMPEGSHATLLVVGNTVRRLFDGDLTAVHRAELLRQVAGLAFNDLNTDLGGALAESAASLGAASGHKEIWMLTDGENSPPRKSKQRGKRFADILTTMAIPPGVEVNIRLFGNRSPDLNPAQAKVYRVAPDWKALFAPPPPPPLPPPAPDPDRWTWRFGYVGLTLCLVGAVLAWFRRSASADARMRQAVAAVAEEPIVAEPPASRFRLESAEGKQLCSLSLDSKSEFSIGDSPLADVMREEADGGLVRFSVVRNRDGERLELSNEGSIPVRIGELEVKPRRRQLLPTDVLEISIGRLRLHMWPDPVAATEVNHV